MRPIKTRTPAPPKTPGRKPPKPRSSVKDPVEVYCRIRPIHKLREEKCVEVISDTTIQLNPPDLSLAGKNGQKAFKNSFKYVFDEDQSQGSVFKSVALPLVEDLIKGKNGLLFTYGVTSSGKTHTMTGSPNDSGIMPRCLDVIFNSINELQARKYVFIPDKMNGFDLQSNVDAMLDQQKELVDCSKTPKGNKKKESEDWAKRSFIEDKVPNVDPDYVYAVFVSYIEVYNNYVYDLLEDRDSLDHQKFKQQAKILREDINHNMYIHSCTETEIKNPEDAFDIFYKGQKRRRLAQTVLNHESSRSHSIFTIRLVQAPLDSFGSEVLQDKTQVCVSQLSLVDLAGSERTARTQNTGSRLKEASSINTSLMALRTCIEVLRENQTQGMNRLVPYRDTKLTHLFKNYFDGEGKIKMIVCVNPRAEDYDENIHVMKFSEITQEVLISRQAATPHRHNLGLMPGRGILFREAVKRAKEDGVEPEEFETPLFFTLGNQFPDFILNSPNDDEKLSLLEQHLIDRLARRQALIQELDKRQAAFRERLVSFEDDYGKIKDQFERQKADLRSRDQQIVNLEKKLAHSEQIIDTLRQKVYLADRNVEVLSKNIDEKDHHIGKNHHMMRQYKMKVQEQMIAERERMKRLMEKRLKEKQAELESKMCFNDEKFRQLQKILSADDWFDIAFDQLPATTPKSHKKPAPATPMKKNIQSTSDSKFETESELYKVQSAISQRKLPVSNIRHRRSRSSNADVWLDHRPVGNLELETVFRPKLKKKKSVSQLNVKDVTNEASKYVLTNQKQLRDGNLKTELYKGDVIPTSGGGAQVVFNDVEVLKQKSPPYHLRKRTSSESENSYDGNLDVKGRCSIGIEGHAANNLSSKKRARI